MTFHIITIFPELFSDFVKTSLIKRAINNSIIKIKIYDLRKYGLGKRKAVDSKPYGGGVGMLLRVEPVYNCVKDIKKISPKAVVYILTPKGTLLNQKKILKISKKKSIILICGRYEGFDQRIFNLLKAKPISIGNFILMGGEVPAMAIIEAASRLIPGVLGKTKSSQNESFSCNLLENPQYTLPSKFRNNSVPKILLSGNHKLIDTWRKEKSIKITKKNRPDLLKKF